MEIRKKKMQQVAKGSPLFCPNPETANFRRPTTRLLARFLFWLSANFVPIPIHRRAANDAVSPLETHSLQAHIIFVIRTLRMTSSPLFSLLSDHALMDHRPVSCTFSMHLSQTTFNLLRLGPAHQPTPPLLALFLPMQLKIFHQHNRLSSNVCSVP